MHQRQHAEPGHRHLADLQVVGILDHSVHRGANLGPRQVEPGLVDRRLRLRDRRLLAWGERGMGVRRPRARVGEVLLGGLHLVQRILIVGTRGETLLQQRLLPRQRILLDLEVGLLADDVRARARRLRPQLARLEPRCGQLRRSLLQRHAIGCRIDPEQQVAAFHPGAVAHEHLDDRPVHLRAHRDNVLLHLRVVGRDAAAAREIIIAAAEQQQRRDDQHRHRAQQPLPGRQPGLPSDLRRLLGRCRGGHRFGRHLVH